MNRRMYQPTETQERKWALIRQPEMPSDERFQEMWKKAHHGKISGWGIGKRDWIISNLKNSRDYQMGLWQGRVDKLRGVEYSEERIDAAYNLGYFRGYMEFDPCNPGGWDRATFDAFITAYGIEEEA